MNLSRYLPAAGLFGLSLYQLSTGDYPAALQSVFAALALLGVHVGEAQAQRRLNMVEELANQTADLTAETHAQVNHLHLTAADFLNAKADSEADSSGSSE